MRSSEQGPLVGLAVLLVVSLLTMKSDRRELVDKVKGEVISQGQKTWVWLLHWSHIGVYGSSGISFH